MITTTLMLAQPKVALRGPSNPLIDNRDQRESNLRRRDILRMLAGSDSARSPLRPHRRRRRPTSSSSRHGRRN